MSDYLICQNAPNRTSIVAVVQIRFMPRSFGFEDSVLEDLTRFSYKYNSIGFARRLVFVHGAPHNSPRLWVYCTNVFKHTEGLLTESWFLFNRKRGPIRA